MKKILIAAVTFALTGGIFAMSWFGTGGNSWDDYDKAARKGLPRTATNVLEKIAREALAKKDWQNAARAIITRANVEKGIRDEEAKEWLPKFVARVDAAPAELQGVLQLHLAHVYLDESQPWRWGGARPTKLSDEAATNLPPWAPERLNETLEAQFAKVLSRADDLKACRVENWNFITSRGTLPDAYRPTLFDLAVHDMVNFYGRTIPDSTLEKGLALIDRLIEFHRDDDAKEALADAELARLRYEHSFAQLPDKERAARYAAALDAFIARYIDVTEVSAFAVAARADLIKDAGDLVGAHAKAEIGAKRWHESMGGRLCVALMKDLEQPDFTVTTENTWNAPWPDLVVKSKNMTNVWFRVVPISFDDIRDKSVWDNGYYRAEDTLKKLAKDARARTWQVAVEDHRDYEMHEAKFPVPSDLAPGHYVLFAAMDGRFGDKNSPLLSQIVTVTDLALAQSGDNGSLRGKVWRAESGEPVCGATVEIWEAKDGRKYTLAHTLKTEKDGSFSLRKDRVYGYLRVRDGAHEVLSLSTIESGNDSPEKETFGHVDVLTDRGIYRPGQTIHFKGVAFYANPHARDFRVLPGAKVVVNFMDPNGKPVGSAKLTTNPWGSFHGEFAAPRDRLTGSYKLEVRALAEGTWVDEQSTVQVEEYRRPKFSAEFELGSADGVLGQKATVKGRARTYSGLPVQGAYVAWTVTRRTSYSSWWYWLWGDCGQDDDGCFASGETVTDADGAFSVSFVPEPSPTADLTGEPTFQYEILAVVADSAGETHAAGTSIRVGTVAWSASVGVSDRWLAVDGAGKSAAVQAYVGLNTLGGKPVCGKGTLRVFALKGPYSPVRKPIEEGRYYGGYGRRGKKENAPQPWNWERWEPGAEVLSRTVETDEDGAWKGTLDLPAGAYRLVFEAQDPQGKAVKAMGTCAVFDTSGSTCAITVPEFFRVQDYNVKVGDAIRLYWASGYATGYCRLTLRQNGKTLYDHMTDPSKPVHYLEFPVRDENRGEIYVDTEFLRENRLYHESERISVPWDNMDLKITREHFTSKLVPGTEEKWAFTVNAPSEMVALMYDKSLDAFVRHNPFFFFDGYFTPRHRWPSTPQLQNKSEILYHLNGYFPGGGHTPDVTWRQWKSDTLAIRMDRSRKSAGAVGSAVMADMACAEAPAAADGSVAADSDGLMATQTKPDADVPVRKNLQETAFFLPTLETDANGRVSFTFTVPDALTGWKFVAFAHDKGLRNGILRDDTIVTTKPLMCEPNAPRFVREGDDFLFAVKITNTEDAPQKGTVSLAFEEAVDSRKSDVEPGVGCRPSNVAPQTPTQPFTLAPHESKSFSFRVKIPDGCGYLKYTARAKGETFADGEEGWLPVLSRSILVREAVQLQVRGAGARTFALSNLLASAKSDSIRNVDLTVRAVSRPAWYAVLALPYLMEFPHECCEQTFSRYYANTLGAFIANSDPRIRATFEKWKAAGGDTLKSPLEQNEDLKTITLDSTPWVREAANETTARRRVGELFDTERLASEQARCLDKLVETRNDDGLWPWFPGGDSSDGITLYILTGFARLNRLTGAEFPDFFVSACQTLDKEVVAEVVRRVREAKKLKVKFHASGWDVQWLYLHSFPGVPSANAKTKNLLLKHIADEWLGFGYETQAYAAIVLHRFGKKRAAKDIIASLKERAIVSDEMGMYWKRPSFYSSSLFAAPVSTQAAIIEAFMEVTGDAESVDACRAWLLKQKQTQNWSSTASTVDAIYAILLGGGRGATALPGGMDLLAGDTLATVTLGGKEVPKVNAEAGTGLYTHKVPMKEIKPEMGAITFVNDAKGGVAWGGVHWSYFEDVLKVRTHEPKELHVEKKYYRKVRGPQGTRLAPIEGVLEVGDELVARIVLSSDRIFEYVHVQDERPACAEPVDVLSSYRWQDGVGYYQSTRDTATHYYIDRLGKGTFVLETSFRVQQRGTFVGGLATVQCMYAPEFTAHSSAERVEVHSVQ